MDQELLGEILETLREVRAFSRIRSAKQLESICDSLFSEEQQRNAYRLFYEGESYRAIGKAVGVSHVTVSRWVDEWRGHGLVHPTKQVCFITPGTLGL